jgi:PAS domain S-box-containing protein
MEQLLLNIRRAIEKQQTENALKENELRLKLLFDSQPSCILVVDSETHTITDANPAAVRLIGSSKEKIVGNVCHRFVCPAEVGRCPITDLGMKIENSDSELLNVLGETVPIVKTVVPITLNGRKCLIESFIDITERKRMENELQKTKNVAEESAQRLEFVLEGSNDATWEWDMITNEGVINARYYEMTEFTPGEVDTNYDFFMKTVHPDDVPEVLRRVKEHIEGRVGTYETHYRMVTKTGKQRHVLGRGKIVKYDADGRPTKMAGVVSDITELKRLSDEVNRIHNLESIGLLAGGLAHDFNNVLNIIYGNITYTRMMAGENEAITEPLRDAEEACERAKELGVRLQIFSQGGYPAKEPITLPKVIDNAAGTVFNNSKIMHNITVAADLFSVEADPRQIRRVFENLLINAKEAMVDGGTVNINIKNCVIDGKEGLPLESGSYIRIALEDEGKGIPEDILPKIFDPYFSTKDTYSQKGLGLGLSICHSVIKRHRGHISIDSKVGVGTKVTVYLPASAESAIVEDRACTRGVT